MATDISSKEESPTYRRLSKGDPSKVTLVQIEERNGRMYAGYSARALLPGAALRPPSRPLVRSVPQALRGANEWASVDMPIRIVLLGAAEWDDKWGMLVGAGDHPSFFPLTVSEIVDHGARIIHDHIGATIVGVERYRNAIGFTLAFPDGSLRALMVRANPDNNDPGWLDPSSLVLSELASRLQLDLD